MLGYKHVVHYNKVMLEIQKNQTYYNYFLLLIHTI